MNDYSSKANIPRNIPPISRLGIKDFILNHKNHPSGNKISCLLMGESMFDSIVTASS